MESTGTDGRGGTASHLSAEKAADRQHFARSATQEEKHGDVGKVRDGDATQYPGIQLRRRKGSRAIRDQIRHDRPLQQPNRSINREIYEQRVGRCLQVHHAAHNKDRNAKAGADQQPDQPEEQRSRQARIRNAQQVDAQAAPCRISDILNSDVNQ